MMSKKIFNYAFLTLTIIVMSSITGCKKGENDPALSLRTRKARISGEWKLSKGTESFTFNNGGTSGSSTTTYTNATVSTDGNTSSYTETFTIEKDGTFETVIVADGETFTTTGNWFFAGKIKDLDLKKKEAIVLNTLTESGLGYSSTTTGLLDGGVLIIDQLKNKEIVFKGSYSSSGSGSSSTSNYERTYEKK